MTGQPPKEATVATGEATARETAKKVQDMADDVLQMSTMSVVSRSKATVLQLEAKNLLAALDKKKSQESAEDTARAQRLLGDIERLRGVQQVKTPAPEAPVKKKVTLMEAPKQPRRSTEQARSADNVGIGIHDESIKDEESRALLRRASTFAPNTGSAVEMPDADIAAIVAQKLEEKSHSTSSPASHRSPTLSAESIGRRAKATVLAAIGRHTPVPSKPVSPALSRRPSPRPSKKTAQSTPKKVSPAPSKNSPTTSKHPSTDSSKDVPAMSPVGSPWTSKRNSPVTSRQLSPVPSLLNIEPVKEQRNNAHIHWEHGEAHSSRQPRITPSMVREKDELNNVIKELLKSAEANVEEDYRAPPYASYAENQIATVFASDTSSRGTEKSHLTLRFEFRPKIGRSVDSDHFYTTLRRRARKNPAKFCVRVCCSLALLGLAVLVVAVTLVYGNRAFAKRYSGVALNVQAPAQNSSGTLGGDQRLHNRHQSEVGHGSHAGSLQELTSTDIHTTNVTAEAPYYNDEILDICQSEGCSVSTKD